MGYTEEVVLWLVDGIFQGIIIIASQITPDTIFKQNIKTIGAFDETDPVCV